MGRRRPYRHGAQEQRVRRGYVLLGVLWAVVALAALAMVAGVAGREAVAATANRVALARAAWRAEDCAARALAAVDAAMRDAGGWSNAGSSPNGPIAVAPEQLARAWRMLDLSVARSPLVPRDGDRACTVRLASAGAALALTLGDDAEDDAMHRLLGALQVPPPLADSLVDALLDWRDVDDTPRPAGAEAGWYLAHGRPPPRNAPFAATAELDRVRGFDAAALDARVPGLHAALQSLVSADTVPVDLSHAPREVLLTLPGMTPEAVEAVLATRARIPGAPVDLSTLSTRLSHVGAAAFGTQLGTLQARTTPEPDAWILTAWGTAGAPPVTAALELRLVRSGVRAALVRRRTWVE